MAIYFELLNKDKAVFKDVTPATRVEVAKPRYTDSVLGSDAFIS